MHLNLTSDRWDSWRQSSELLCVFFSVDEIVLVLSTLPFRCLVIWKCGYKFFHIFIHPEMGCLSEWIWVSSWLRVQLLWSSMKYKVRSLKATQWLLPCSVDSPDPAHEKSDLSEAAMLMKWQAGVPISTPRWARLPALLMKPPSTPARSHWGFAVIAMRDRRDPSWVLFTFSQRHEI